MTVGTNGTQAKNYEQNSISPYYTVTSVHPIIADEVTHPMTADASEIIAGAVISTGSASKTVTERKPPRPYRYTYHFLENEIMKLPYRKRLTLAWHSVMNIKRR